MACSCAPLSADEKDQDFESASKTFHTLLRLNPDDAATLTKCGLCAEEEGDLDGAADFYRQAIAINPADRYTLHNLGFVLGELGRAKEAIDCYYKLLSFKPQDLQRATDDSDDDDEEEEKSKEGDSDVDALYQLARLLHDEGLAKEAAVCLEKLVRRVPTDLVSLKKLALVLEDCGDLGRAEEITAAVLEDAPDDSSHYFDLARIKQRLGKFGSALNQYREGLTIDPENSTALVNPTPLAPSNGSNPNML